MKILYIPRLALQPGRTFQTNQHHMEFASTRPVVTFLAVTFTACLITGLETAPTNQLQRRTVMSSLLYVGYILRSRNWVLLNPIQLLLFGFFSLHISAS